MSDGDKITASSFLASLWNRRLLILASTLICLCAALLYGFLSPTKYTVSMLVAPVTPFETPGSSGASGLASSLLLGKQNDPKFSLFQTVIRTDGFARYLNTKYGYIEKLRRGYDVDSVGAFHEFLRKNIVIIASGDDSNTVEIDMEFPDAEFAKTLLSRTFLEGNEIVRLLDVGRAQKFSDYVRGRFAQEGNKSLQDAMLTLLLTQERFLMVTKVDLPYAANLIDGPTVSEKPTSPKMLLLAAIGLIAGFSFGICGVFVLDVLMTAGAVPLGTGGRKQSTGWRKKLGFSRT